MLQVVEICLQQQLYDALIHVHNRGLHDYATPLLELLLQLRATLKRTGKNLPSETGREGGRVVIFRRGLCIYMYMYSCSYISAGDAQKLGYKLLVYIRYSVHEKEIMH